MPHPYGTRSDSLTQTRPSGASSLFMFNSSFSILSSAACSGRQRGKSARLSHLRGRNSGHHTGAQVDSLDHHNYILHKAFINHRFSSKAESHMFRLWGADVVNMTTIPEVYQSSQPKSFTPWPPPGGAGQGGRVVLCSHCNAHRLRLLERGASC